MGDAVVIGLAAWALTWLLSFWYRTERLRESLGIYFVSDGQGEPTDREDKGGLSSWVNCPQCCALLCWLMPSVVYLACNLNSGARATLDGGARYIFLPYTGKAVLSCLGGLGLVLLLVRWYESARPKARWWE